MIFSVDMTKLLGEKKGKWETKRLVEREPSNRVGA
jgi:hypothetical protein